MRYVILSMLISLSGKIDLNNSKKLEYKDMSYEEEIKTVQLYPNTGNSRDVLESPIAPLNQNTLTLEFDDLVESHEDYRVMLIHCNSDWTKSKLKPLDYLSVYNEFMITNFEYSVDTKIGYIHYAFKVPNVKISGNYLLVAYRGSDTKDIILSKRFMIYERNVGINILSNRIGLTSVDRGRQKVDFEVSYGQFEILNPQDQVNVVIRQNQRWDNAMTNIQPQFVKEGQQLLEYRFFDRESNFYAGNEYRFFDLRSLRYPGQNVLKVDLSTYPNTAYIMNERGRGTQAYAQYDDINGDYYIQNTDTGDGQVQSDYVNVVFNLQLDSQFESDVYVVGKMNNYDPRSKMLNMGNGQFKYETILKQGFYNYQYLVKGAESNSNLVEGDHFETENRYEILIYFQPLNLPAEILIGYAPVTLNTRNN